MARVRPGWALLALATVAVAGANAYVWGGRIVAGDDIDFRYRSASYDQLYVPAGAPRVAGFEVVSRGRLAVELAGLGAATWTVARDGTATTAAPGPRPILDLAVGKHRYRLDAVGRLANTSPSTAATDPIDLRVAYRRSGHYAAGGRTLPDSYRLVSADLPLVRNPGPPPAAFRDAYPPNQLAAARAELKHRTVLAESSTDRARATAIAAYLLSRLDGRRGTPSDALHDATPMKQYRYALGGTAQVWCVNLTAIYALFAEAAGLPTRTIYTGGELDGVKLSAHTFAESYLADEGRWAYVDLTTRTLAVTDAAGRVLGAADLLHAHRLGRGEGLWALDWSRGATAAAAATGATRWVPYPAVAGRADQYFARDARLLYKKAESFTSPLPLKLQRALKVLFRPDLSYGLGGSAGAHRVTVALFWGLVGLALVWLGMGFRWLRSRRRGSPAAESLPTERPSPPE